MLEQRKIVKKGVGGAAPAQGSAPGAAQLRCRCAVSGICIE